MAKATKGSTIFVKAKLALIHEYKPQKLENVNGVLHHTKRITTDLKQKGKWIKDKSML